MTLTEKQIQDQIRKYFPEKGDIELFAMITDDNGGWSVNDSWYVYYESHNHLEQILHQRKEIMQENYDLQDEEVCDDDNCNYGFNLGFYPLLQLKTSLIPV